MQVVGLDACRGGWAAVLLDADGATEGRFLATVADVDALDVAGIGIDIPIGLPEAEQRRSDRLVRDELGPRRSSVFPTPTRDALAQETHAAASARQKELTGAGMSIQAWGLREKVLEVDAWVRDTGADPWEVHPELAFTLLRDGEPCAHPKRTWAGQLERRRALAAAGVELGDVGEVGGIAGADDVLDAAAVAWSTRRLVAGEGRSWPDPPDQYRRWPLPVAIWA